MKTSEGIDHVLRVKNYLHIPLPLKLCHHFVTTKRQYPDLETICMDQF